MAQAWTLDRNEGGSKKCPFVAHILSLTPRYSQLPPSFTPDRSACGGNRERSCWGSETVGGGVGMTATAGAVAVLRTCEPWTSLFHMALACRVTRNTVMMAVIAHPAVWPPTPTRSSPEREENGRACVQNAESGHGKDPDLHDKNRSNFPFNVLATHYPYSPPSLPRLPLTAAVTTPPELLPELQEESCHLC